jgi:hypothetical protein
MVAGDIRGGDAAHHGETVTQSEQGILPSAFETINAFAPMRQLLSDRLAHEVGKGDFQLSRLGHRPPFHLF